MADLLTASEDEIKAELERRAAATLPMPEVVASPNFSDLVGTITEGTAYTLANGYEDKDFQYYVYEAAITAVYGPGYWAWRRQQKF